MHKSYLKYAKNLPIFLAVFGLLGIQAAVDYKASPDTIILCFDIDDVLLIKKAGKITKAFMKKTGTIATSLFQPKIFKRYSQLKKLGVPTEVLAHEFEKMNKPKLAKLVRDIAHSKVPIKGIEFVLRDLKARGYTLHLLSNMGKADLEFYTKKYPHIFDLFDGALVVEYIPGQAVLKKPSPAYFDLYRSRFPTNKRLLLIDDKKENCNASGFDDTIVFVNVKQLRSELQARSIL